MAKRKTAEQAQESVPESSTPAAPSDSGQPTPGTDASAPAGREPGEEPQPSWVKRASIIVDPEAGVKFHFDYERHQAIITFNEKPAPDANSIATDWSKVRPDGDNANSGRGGSAASTHAKTGSGISTMPAPPP